MPEGPFAIATDPPATGNVESCISRAAGAESCGCGGDVQPHPDRHTVHVKGRGACCQHLQGLHGGGTHEDSE